MTKNDDLVARARALREYVDNCDNTCHALDYTLSELDAIIAAISSPPPAAPGDMREALAVFRICEHCNQEYRTPIGPGVSVYNFGDCPHCKHRDDAWIRVEAASAQQPARKPCGRLLTDRCDAPPAHDGETKP